MGDPPHIADTVLASDMQAIAREIDAAFAALLAGPDDARMALYAAMRHAAIGGGKRLRPLLVLGSARLFDVDPASALRVGAAIEAVHVYSLIHDDLPAMDDDDMRRGKPTVHKAFDEATAILAGDALHSLAFEWLAAPETHTDPAVRVDLVGALARAAGPAGMVGGQALDLAAQHGDLDIAAITRLQRLKTGALIAVSVEAGAILGYVPKGDRTPLHGYAQDVGLAFQIADDLLDAEGDASRVGKATGKDGAAGKQTFVALMGADRARAQARMLVDQAIVHLDGFGDRADLLRAIARYSVERDR